MEKYLKIINITRRQLALFLVFLGTVIFASAGIISLMTYALSDQGFYFVIYDQMKFNISLILPLIFFVIFAVAGLIILLTGKESYQFSNKLIKNSNWLKIVILFVEIIQLIIWALFIIILMTYFYPVNKSIDEIYQAQTLTVDFNNNTIYSGLLSFIQINNNFFADLKISILNYASILPYFFNKDSFTFWNIVYLALYLSFFLAYVKLSLFKQKQKLFSLIPFAGLISYVTTPNNLEQNVLSEPDTTGLKWYQKILASNQTVFKIKLTKTTLSLSLFYLASVLGFVIYAIAITFMYGIGFKLKPSVDVNNAYVYDFNRWNSQFNESELRLMTDFSTALMAFFIITFVVMSLGIILDKKPYTFGAVVGKNEVRLSLTLLAIDITQSLFYTLIFYFYVANAYHSLYPLAVPLDLDLDPDLRGDTDRNNAGWLYGSQDLFITTSLVFVLTYLSWFLAYAKGGVFSRRTRILMYVPFASLFFVKYHVGNPKIRNNNINRCRLLY
ncbi:putative hypothetical membrane domain protein [Mycoplasmoides gallisepticum WI01_2001.043-13-2P]|uniref:Putative hypothetical membrane domain protein n=1 Tax=Mycoplasmoides gallisepticum WI01_2001.043-13-2P TaxID=1159201 RepID=J3VGP5_MYCGL|nr:hypothetical protein [Mycoplasmoides gallisepticum]AFP78798.1 putative hypothetical membrane domain protein [Mycoplasmoides gallisepticum WI01_2001.043-13-2P]